MNVSVNRNPIIVLFEYLLALVLILECRSVFSVMIDKNFYFTYIAVVITCVLIILRGLILKGKIIKETLFIVIFSCLYIGVFIVINNGAFNTLFITKYMILFSCFIIYFSMEKRQLKELYIFKCIVNIMVILAYISLFFWIFGSVMGLIQTTCTIWYVWGGEKIARGYYFLSYITQEYNLSEIGLPIFLIIRNTGIFTEAPMYNINLCIALLIEMFLYNNTKSYKVKIFVVTIITTFSTLGIFVLMSLFCINWVKNNSNSKLIKIIRMLIFPCLIFVMLLGILYFFESKSSSISWRGHSGDFVAGFLAWKDHPIWGHGYGNYEALLQYYYGDLLKLRIRNSGFSNSITYLLAQCGIWMFAFYYVPFGRYMYRSIKKKNKDNFIWIAFIMILYSVVLVTYQCIFIMILAAIYSNLLMKDKGENSIEQQ